MRLLDEQYTRTPFYGVPKMTEWLRGQGEVVNEKRVRRLLRELGLEAVYPKARLSKPAVGHRIYPYLLRNLAVTRVNQVWSSDITYIRLHPGFVYLVAIIDWFSRFVLSWEVSITLESNFCVAALDWALQLARPGPTGYLQHGPGRSVHQPGLHGTVIGAADSNQHGWSRSGVGQYFVERLWRTVKYEDIYLKEYRTITELLCGLTAYFKFYNEERLHEAL
jgi:putative transposase